MTEDTQEAVARLVEQTVTALVHALVIVFSPRLFLRNYRALRRDGGYFYCSVRIAAEFAGWSQTVDDFLTRRFVWWMERLWGEDESWMDRLR